MAPSSGTKRKSGKTWKHKNVDTQVDGQHSDQLLHPPLSGDHSAR